MADGPLIDVRALDLARGLDRAANQRTDRSWRPSTMLDASPARTTRSGISIVHADTPELRRISYRLRYDVYCVENTFLDAAHYPDRLETDEYDRHSLHALLQHNATGDFIGTVRLITPMADRHRTTTPFHAMCGDTAVHDILPAGSTAEVSRFAISKSFRRRAEDGTYPGQFAAAQPRISERRLVPILSLGLIAAVTQLGLACGITHICAVMEPALLRLLRRLGIEFNLAGPLVDYHGLRQPCYAAGAELLEQVRATHPACWDMMMGANALASPSLQLATC